MTDNGRGEDELEKLEGLDEIDVTECAEDNERLKVKFQEKVNRVLVLSCLEGL